MASDQERIYRGILHHARERGWSVTTGHEMYEMPIRRLRGWRGDGAIGMILTRRDRQIAESLSMPVVTVSGALREPGVCRVTVDNEAAGRLAADHLLDRGFQNFAYLGVRGVWYSQARQKGFMDRIRAAGFTASSHQATTLLTGAMLREDESERLGDWLGSLGKPLGIMACSDQRARMLADACVAAGIRVPDDVAVIGMDDDEDTCTFEDPQISSVAPDSWQIGVEAAKMLERLMDGETKRTELHIPPRGITARNSTDVFAVHDRAVADAVKYIRERLDEPFGVEALVKHIDVSRRQLERRFVAALNCSPYEFICRQRVQQAKRLLVDPAKPKLIQVSRRCGFRDSRRFGLVFRRVTGTTPAAYRAAATRAD